MNAIDDFDRYFANGCERGTHCTKGNRYTLVLASTTKGCLKGEMPEQMRLEFLQHLDRMTDEYLKPEIIAMVQPMPDEAEELLREIRKLGPMEALDQYADPGVFRALVALNPSLLHAIKEADRVWYRRS